MRIIAGSLKRRTLFSPTGLDTRPTMDRIRQRIFDLLQTRFDFDSAVVLDLFAGTGAMGFEAISRGAKSVVFLDNHTPAVQLIHKNANALGVSTLCKIINRDAFEFLNHTNESFDIIFSDPPYDTPEPHLLVETVLEKNILREHGYFIFEHSSMFSFDGAKGFSFSIKASRKTCISFFQQIS